MDILRTSARRSRESLAGRLLAMAALAGLALGSTVACSTEEGPPSCSIDVFPHISDPLRKIFLVDTDGYALGSDKVTTFNFGDGSKAVGPVVEPVFLHTFPAPGAYTVEATVLGSQPGQDPPIERANCQTTITLP